MNGGGGDGKTELQERDLDPEQASVSGAEHTKPLMKCAGHNFKNCIQTE